ncbi:class I SAM-dependent methyltransferase [Aliiglaciecola sp. LCG003]|uniref:class I SAM-dependent methyltransferase n=1 Tax=Aliiglaciecola sp. LCG003 TaxID=3053655 RepID=UPI002573A626|nr:class I SAM-dependent methyltransferase [Aliiglaciecola sp. LCG003]WJG08355.1 class I SAM-dependent methyltransferase [Aliiglaciecola sp. LCG003]
MQQVWTDFFAQLDSGSRILDIGTGNGALLDIAIQSNKNFQLVGVDSAELTIPDSLDNAENVHFKQKVNAQNLPFENQYFDVVISQFGIEYANLSLALPELVRVMKPDGQFQLVMHEVNSSIVKPNADILNAAIGLNAENGVLFQLRKLINALAKNDQRSVHTENCRISLNEAITQLANGNHGGLLGTDFPAFLKHIMSPTLTYTQRKEKLKLFTRELKGQIIRLSDLVAAALTQQRYEAVLDTLQSLNLIIEQDYMLKENNIAIAKVLRGQKN